MRQRQSLISSFRCAVRGIAVAIRNQRNIKIQLAWGLMAIGLAAALQVAVWEWIVMLGCVGAVLMCEVMNFAIEQTVDLASPEIHPLARNAKDAAAGAVLISAISAAVIGLMILAPKLWSYIQMKAT